MAKVKVFSHCPLFNGLAITFAAPCDCSAVDGLTVSFDGKAQDFIFRDTNGFELTRLGNLFSEGAFVRVILDTVNSHAYIQNAATNNYLEMKISERLLAKEYPVGSACFYHTKMNGDEEWLNPKTLPLTPYRTMERLGGNAIYRVLYPLGELPSNSGFMMPWRLGDNIVKQVISASGFATNGAMTYHIPYTLDGNSCNFEITNNGIVGTTTGFWNGYRGFLLIEYLDSVYDWEELG